MRPLSYSEVIMECLVKKAKTAWKFKNTLGLEKTKLSGVVQKKQKNILVGIVVGMKYTKEKGVAIFIVTP